MIAGEVIQPRTELIDIITGLVEEGILGSELMPEPDYWHWPVLKPDLLPSLFHIYKGWQYGPHGEVRWYGV